MRAIAIILAMVSVMAAHGVAAQQMTGYSLDIEAGDLSTFTCRVDGDLDCFRVRTGLGSIAGDLTRWSSATALSPGGQLVIVDRVGAADHRLVWFDLPTLHVASILELGTGVGEVFDVVFGPGAALWLLGTPTGSDVPTLFRVDTSSGDVTAVWSSGWTYQNWMSITTLGERFFVTDEQSTLWEVVPDSGATRLVMTYATPPWGGTVFISLSTFGGRLWATTTGWSTGPQPAERFYELGSIDPDTGTWDPLVLDFGYVDSSHPGFTLDLTGASLQQPGIPAVGPAGAASLILLILIAGWLEVQRRRAS